MRLELLPPTHKFLQYKCIEELVRKEPMTTKSGNLRYAVAGGGAVMLLCEAASVVGYEIVNSGANNARKHKDLELILGEPVFRNRYPHDIVHMDDSGDIHRINYRGEVPSGDLFIELLNGFYFDFKVPSAKDVTAITTERGNTFLTLKPEFLIASKLFSANGLRRIDQEDSLALLQRFNINFDYLWSFVESSEFGKVISKEEVENVESLFESGEFFDLVCNRIKDTYASIIQNIDIIPYSEKISVLKYTPEELALNHDQERFIRQYLERLTFRCDSDKEIYNLCMRYVTSELDPNMSPPDVLDTLVHKDQHTAVAVSTNLKQVLHLLRKVIDPEERKEEYNRMATKLVEKGLNTDYIHVFTTAMKIRLLDYASQGTTDFKYGKLVTGF